MNRASTLIDDKIEKWICGRLLTIAFIHGFLAQAISQAFSGV